MAAYLTPKAVVLTVDGVFYDDGRAHPLSDRFQLTDLSTVLVGAAQAFRGGEGVVIVDSPMPTEIPSLVAENWRVTELRPWTTFVGKTLPTGQAVLHVAFLPSLLANRRESDPLLTGNSGPADIAMRLGRYQQLVGVPWRYTAGVTGCAALRARFTDPRPGRQPLWHSDGPKGIRGAGPLIWRAPEQPDPADGRMVAMFDINAMYLAALKNARVAWGELQHTGLMMFDPDWPGWWEVNADDVPAELTDGRERPPMIRTVRKHAGGLWLSTPVAKYLMEKVGTFTVLDSYTSMNGQALIRPLADRLAAARVGDLGPMGPCGLAIKRTYAELVGMMLRPGGSIYRPDWGYTPMDLARVNFLRRTDRAYELTKLRPFEVRTDAAYFLVQDRAELERLSMALGIGAGPGTFKKPTTLTVAEHMNARKVRA